MLRHKALSFFFRVSLFFLFVTSGSAVAQTQTSLDLALEIVEVRNTGRLAVQTLAVIIEQQKQKFTQVPDDIWTKIQSEIKAEDLNRQVAPVFVKHFSFDELQEMLKFYKSPVGQKMIAKSTVLGEESAKVGREWGITVSQQILARLKEEGY